MAGYARGEAARRIWGERLERLADSGLSVKEFCAEEQIGVASLYQWRRRLAHAEVDSTDGQRSSFQPVRIVGGGMVTVEFPGMAAMRIPAERVDLVRAVVTELARESRSASSC